MRPVIIYFHGFNLKLKLIMFSSQLYQEVPGSVPCGKTQDASPLTSHGMMDVSADLSSPIHSIANSLVFGNGH